MKEVVKYSVQGKLSGLRDRECQDKVAYKKKKDVRGIALADGAGSACKSATAAEAIGEVLTEFIVSDFDALYQLEEKELRYNILICLREKLYEICKEEQVEFEELKSTFLAFGINDVDKRYLLFHLGDGMAGVTLEDGKQVIVSEPENGNNKAMTKLVTSIPVAESIRISKGVIRNATQVFLLSDGWRELKEYKNEIPRFEKYIYNQGKELLITEDDISAILMEL